MGACLWILSLPDCLFLSKSKTTDLMFSLGTTTGPSISLSHACTLPAPSCSVFMVLFPYKFPSPVSIMQHPVFLSFVFTNLARNTFNCNSLFCFFFLSCHRLFAFWRIFRNCSFYLVLCHLWGLMLAQFIFKKLQERSDLSFFHKGWIVFRRGKPVMYQALGSVLWIHFLSNFLKCPGEVGFTLSFCRWRN